MVILCPIQLTNKINYLIGKLIQPSLPFLQNSHFMLLNYSKDFLNTVVKMHNLPLLCTKWKAYLVLLKYLNIGGYVVKTFYIKRVRPAYFGLEFLNVFPH